MTIPQVIPLTCPSCGASITVKEGETHFTCGYCGNENLLSVALQPPASAAAAAPQPALLPRVPMPESVKIVKDGRGARIIQRWFSLKYIPMALFALFWDGFLVFWYGIAFSTGAPLIMKIFPLIHVAVGVGVTYSTLAGFVNRTTVELTRDELAVWYEPLPWPGEKTIKTAEIQQLFCKETVTRGKNGYSYSYQLYAVTRDNRQVKLISKLDSPDVARFFEQQLEDWLKIEDRPVVGEMERG